MCRPIPTVVIVPIFIAIVAGGCAGKKAAPALTDPPVAVGLNHFAGTPLSGPVKPPSTMPGSGDAVALTVRLTAVRGVAAEGLAPLSSRARMLTIARGSEPILAVAQLAGRARFGEGQSAETFLAQLQSSPPEQRHEIHTFTDALIPGVTSSIDVISLASADRRSLRLQIHRPADKPQTLQLGIWIEDMVIATSPAEESPPNPETATPPAKVSQRELVLIDDLNNATSLRSVFFLPFELSDGGKEGMVIDITAANSPTDETAHSRAIERMKADVDRSISVLGARPGELATGSAAASGMAAGITAMRQASTRRSGMLYLAMQGNAPLLEDIALVGDDALLATVAGKIAQQAPPILGSATPADAGWAMESIALSEVIALQSAGSLAQPVQAVVSRLYGEAGRNASSLQEVSKGAPDRPEFQNRLVAENLIYLEDNSPSARMRAFDWLTVRNMAPSGYDPLGPIQQRRASIEKALYSAPTTQGGTR